MELESVRLLKEKGINFSIVELKSRAMTVKDVVKYAKHEINPDEVCKTMILKDRKGCKYAVFLKGGDRLDFNKLQGIIGKASIARSDEVEEATGFKPGAVCPLTLNIPLYIDERVFKKEKINFGSGNHRYGIELSPKDLEKVIDFILVDATKV